MEKKHRMLLHLLLTISILFTGMYPARLRADAFLDYTKNLQGEALLSRCGNDGLKEVTACTAKMLGVHGLRLPQLFSRAASGIGQKQERQFFVCLFFGFAIIYFFCFHITGKTRRFRKLLGIAVILDYIHKMDGKK